MSHGAEYKCVVCGVRGYVGFAFLAAFGTILVIEGGGGRGRGRNLLSRTAQHKVGFICGGGSL